MRSSRRHPTTNAGLVAGAALLLATTAGVRVATPSAPAAEGAASEYDLKAVFIHHLTHYLQWPGPEPSSFEIAVFGESPILSPLQLIAAHETIHERRITIRSVADVGSLDRPQVLFLARPAGPRLAEVLRATRGRPILTIGEEEGLAAKGIAVNFVLRGESIKFEINQAALRASDIQPGSQLLRLAILVGGER